MGWDQDPIQCPITVSTLDDVESPREDHPILVKGVAINNGQRGPGYARQFSMREESSLLT